MSSITINQLIKNTIEQNRYSKRKVATAAGISEKAGAKLIVPETRQVGDRRSILEIFPSRRDDR